MAAAIQPEKTEADAGTDDAENAFFDKVVAKYEKEDRKTMAAEDGVAGDAEEEDESDDAEEDDDDSDDTDEGTSADSPDGDAAESGEESEEGEAEDDTTDDESAESEDADDAAEGDDADAGAAEQEGDAGPTDDTVQALKKHGAVLDLTDVPKEFQPIVTAKLKSIDKAFTRYSQEATAFRKERVAFQAEERFRKEHPERAIVEMLTTLPEDKQDVVFKAVNDMLVKLEDPDQKVAFDVASREARKKMADAVVESESKVEKTLQRVDAIVARAQKRAAEFGIDWELAEEAVELAILRKPENARDAGLTDAEVDQVIAASAKKLGKTVRARRRDESRERIQARSQGRREATPARKGGGGASPRPSGGAEQKVNWNDEESRQQALMRSARRIYPGARDA